jgi:methylmalonyl-CoA mutase
MTDRVALHISNILKEESHLDKVSNAVGGAYAIENIVNELAPAAWHDFQNKMSL